jgi:hypothetical protein
MKREQEHSSQGSPAPSERSGPQSHPDNYSQEQSENREGTFRKAEETASKASNFNDDYEAAQEDEMTQEEANTEEENNS